MKWSYKTMSKGDHVTWAPLLDVAGDTVYGSASLRYAKSCIQCIEELLKEAEDDSKPA